MGMTAGKVVSMASKNRTTKSSRSIAVETIMLELVGHSRRSKCQCGPNGRDPIYYPGRDPIYPRGRYIICRPCRRAGCQHDDYGDPCQVSKLVEVEMQQDAKQS